MNNTLLITLAFFLMFLGGALLFSSNMGVDGQPTAGQSVTESDNSEAGESLSYSDPKLGVSLQRPASAEVGRYNEHLRIRLAGDQENGQRIIYLRESRAAENFTLEEIAEREYQHKLSRAAKSEPPHRVQVGERSGYSFRIQNEDGKGIIFTVLPAEQDSVFLVSEVISAPESSAYRDSARAVLASLKKI